MIGERHALVLQGDQTRNLIEESPIEVIGQNHHDVAERRYLRSRGSRGCSLGLVDLVDDGLPAQGVDVRRAVERGCGSRRGRRHPRAVLAEREETGDDRHDGQHAGDGGECSPSGVAPLHPAAPVRIKVSRIRRTRTMGTRASTAPAKNAQS